jgi:hypothetical protein
MLLDSNHTWKEEPTNISFILFKNKKWKDKHEGKQKRRRCCLSGSDSAIPSLYSILFRKSVNSSLRESHKTRTYSEKSVIQCSQQGSGFLTKKSHRKENEETSTQSETARKEGILKRLLLLPYCKKEEYPQRQKERQSFISFSVASFLAHFFVTRDFLAAFFFSPSLCESHFLGTTRNSEQKETWIQGKERQIQTEYRETKKTAKKTLFLEGTLLFFLKTFFMSSSWFRSIVFSGSSLHSSL